MGECKSPASERPTHSHTRKREKGKGKAGMKIRGDRGEKVGRGEI